MKVGTFRKFDGWGAETFSDQSKSQTLCDMAVIDTIQWVSMEEVRLFNVASLFNSMLCPLMTVYTWLMAWWYILDPNCTKLGVTQVWDLNFFFMWNSMIWMKFCMKQTLYFLILGYFSFDKVMSAYSQKIA